ncbi:MULTISPECIES: GDSL-type esterase/lipase family protein [unclassified Carboxylicivirga]|uniref:GDSL-type esterase/lipase family protein n=1 Tax=Carboxylicivirga TaxID=1628153 RepID=UPI003D346930
MSNTQRWSLVVCVLFQFLAFSTLAQDARFSTYYHQRKTLFEQLPNTRGEIIFLGNSITDGSEWSELLQNKKIKNRGISGDITEGVLYRLDEITESKPAKVFILIGVNDLARGISNDTIVANITKIARQIRTDSPKTKVFIQSILPVNPDFKKFSGHCSKTDDILWINKQLKTVCKRHEYSYVDLFSRFKNADDNFMNPAYTNDGLHLTGAGYKLWGSIVKPLTR